MAMTDYDRFIITDHLAHDWLHERVGFPIDFEPKDRHFAILDEHDRRHPCQFVKSHDETNMEVWFYVEELPAGDTRTFRLVEVDEEVVSPGAVIHAKQQGKWVTVETEWLAVRIAAGQNEDGSWPAPFVGLRGGKYHWMGGSRFDLAEELEIVDLTTEATEIGPLWQTWLTQYRCSSGETFAMQLRVFADEPYVEFREESKLNNEGRIIYSTEGLDPDHLWTDRNRLLGLGGLHGKFGSILMPTDSDTLGPDDYRYAVLINERGESPDCLAVVGIDADYWDHPHENQIDLVRTIVDDLAGHDKGVISFETSIKAGHRAWLLVLANDKSVITTRPYHDNSVNRIVNQYERPLHWLQE